MRYIALVVWIWCLVIGVVFMGDAAQGAVKPINVTATLATSFTVALPPPGRRSDVVQQTWRLNDRSGTRVGRMILSCRWVFRRVRFCNGEIKMPLGEIQVQGTSLTSFLGQYTVIGGTGVYTGCSGIMQLTAIGVRKGALFVTLVS